MGARILPVQLVQEVERYVESELADADRYDNRQPLDEAGVWRLHTLGAEVYGRGWEDGERAQAERENGQRRRDRERATAEPPISAADLTRLIGAARALSEAMAAADERGITRGDTERAALGELRAALGSLPGSE